MDHNTLAVLLQQTLEKSTRENAETELEKIKKIIGFCPGLLQVVMNTKEIPFGSLREVKPGPCSQVVVALITTGML